MQKLLLYCTVGESMPKSGFRVPEQKTNCRDLNGAISLIPGIHRGLKLNVSLAKRLPSVPETCTIHLANGQYGIHSILEVWWVDRLLEESCQEFLSCSCPVMQNLEPEQIPMKKKRLGCSLPLRNFYSELGVVFCYPKPILILDNMRGRKRVLSLPCQTNSKSWAERKVHGNTAGQCREPHKTRKKYIYIYKRIVNNFSNPRK